MFCHTLLTIPRGPATAPQYRHRPVGSQASSSGDVVEAGVEAVGEEVVGDGAEGVGHFVGCRVDDVVIVGDQSAKVVGNVDHGDAQPTGKFAGFIARDDGVVGTIAAMVGVVGVFKQHDEVVPGVKAY